MTMAGRSISTESLKSRDAFAFWQDVICDTFIHLDCTSEKSAAFNGQLHSQPFGDLVLSSMESDPIDLRRTPARISAARDEYCLIVVQGRGRTLAEQDGRQAILDSGDLALFDGMRPYSAGLQSGFHHLVLKIPREDLRRRLGSIEAVAGTRISGNRGLGRIASNFVRGLQDDLAMFDQFTCQRLAQTTMDLIAAALGETTPGGMAATSTRTVHLVRAKAFIASNIQRDDLGPEHVAVALGVSERYLRDLFASDGVSLGRYIWSHRLERCKMALCDPAQARRTISKIAFAWGFNDMSHFSRVFRDCTGASPREYRQTALKG